MIFDFFVKIAVVLIPAESFFDVLVVVLVDSKIKKSLITKLEKALKEVPLKI